MNKYESVSISSFNDMIVSEVLAQEVGLRGIKCGWKWDCIWEWEYKNGNEKVSRNWN